MLWRTAMQTEKVRKTRNGRRAWAYWGGGGEGTYPLKAKRGHPFMTSTKITFLTPLPLSTCVHMGRTPSPLWTSTHGRHEIHTKKSRSLEMASTVTYRT